MQHVDLCVDNLYPNVHEILIKNLKKLLGPNSVYMNGLKETGSAGMGNGQREIPMALLIKYDKMLFLLLMVFFKINLRLCPEKEKS